MKCCRDLRALANRRGDPLDRSGTHVSDGKNVVAACFQQPAAARSRCQQPDADEDAGRSKSFCHAIMEFDS
jgi:hypothetical protein